MFGRKKLQELTDKVDHLKLAVMRNCEHEFVFRVWPDGCKNYCWKFVKDKPGGEASWQPLFFIKCDKCGKTDVAWPPQARGARLDFYEAAMMNLAVPAKKEKK